MSIETTDTKINNKRLATQQSVNWVFRGRCKAIVMDKDAYLAGPAYVGKPIHVICPDRKLTLKDCQDIKS